MGSTIGSRPPPSVAATAPAARASTSSAATGTSAAPKDSFSGSGAPSTGDFGRKTVTQTADQIKAMGPDELKKFEPAEIMGMTKDQFEAFKAKVPFEDLSHDQKRATLRKTILRDLLQYLIDDMSKHSTLGANA